MTPDQRIGFIRERLETHFGHPDMLHDVIVLPDAEWDEKAPADPTNLHRPFGWVPPFEVRVGKGEFWFCPERIARQTTGLTDKELSAYIDIIQFGGDAHVCHYHVDDPWKRMQIVEARLYDKAPGSFDLLNRVQLAVIDQQEK